MLFSDGKIIKQFSVLPPNVKRTIVELLKDEKFLEKLKGLSKDDKEKLMQLIKDDKLLETIKNLPHQASDNKIIDTFTKVVPDSATKSPL